MFAEHLNSYNNLQIKPSNVNPETLFSRDPVLLVVDNKFGTAESEGKKHGGTKTISWGPNVVGSKMRLRAQVWDSNNTKFEITPSQSNVSKMQSNSPVLGPRPIFQMG